MPYYLNEDERTLALERERDDEAAAFDRADRSVAYGDLVFDSPRLGLAYRERVRPARPNRRAVEDVVIGGLLTAATFVSLSLMVGLFILAVELLP